MENKVLSEFESEVWALYGDQMISLYHERKELDKFVALKESKREQMDNDIKGGYWDEGEHGWDCSNSPIGVCVYPIENQYGDDCCHYCGHPEERK